MGTREVPIDQDLIRIIPWNLVIVRLKEQNITIWFYFCHDIRRPKSGMSNLGAGEPSLFSETVFLAHVLSQTAGFTFSTRDSVYRF